MQEYQIRYFGTLNATELAGRYDCTVQHEDGEVSLDLHFDNPHLAPGLDNTINTFLEKALTYDSSNRSAIKEDFANDGEALEIVRFFLDELRPRELKALLGNQEEARSIPLQLLGRLQLVRIGIYADDAKGFFALYDYTLVINDRPFSQVLAVSTDEQGSVFDISWES